LLAHLRELTGARYGETGAQQDTERFRHHLDRHQSIYAYYKPMYAAVSYVVKVFLYMALRQARCIEHSEYDETMKRIAGLGVKKRARLVQRSTSLYNGIVVGPADLPHDLNGRSGNGVSPHWRRGHFRMQAFGVGKLERKLIFVALC
jgi:hypothetical protein